MSTWPRTRVCLLAV
ncbi:hypothetical protein F383_32291 [Gossypium arboreum]|uniref:Uncharacterized protein n=1 Tax=Gossypium arboreum TaxID=29729 RepID=A0A0B0MWE6_GOSAR|nr:hypothetical protein F383_32291 [Gossypium arboreum]